MKNILFIHQASEWYGSDKVLWNIVTGLPKGFHPIVILPNTGILYDKLLQANIETHIAEVVKVSRASLSLKRVLKLPVQIFNAVKALNRIINQRTISLVHSNTLAIFSGAVWAKFYGIPHIWHVHEILLTPKILKVGYPLVLRLFADKVICNSNPTRDWIVNMQPALANKSITIWNGINRKAQPNFDSTAAFRNSLGLKEPGQVLIALVGRINHWKGQHVFIEAANALLKTHPNYVFLIMGSTPNGAEDILNNLKKQIQSSYKPEAIKITPYCDDIWTVWDAVDIAVIPSTLPEPFGLVAIEAMAANKPVIASRHGGLVDIVEDEKSGLLVEPGSAIQLADAIERLAQSAELRQKYGDYGGEIQKKLFSLDAQISKLALVYTDILQIKNSV